MPSKNTKRRILKFLRGGQNIGLAVANARKGGFTQENIAQGSKGAQMMWNSVKRRKGGVAEKNGRVVYIEDGNAPNKAQYNAIVGKRKMVFPSSDTGRKLLAYNKKRNFRRTRLISGRPPPTIARLATSAMTEGRLAGSATGNDTSLNTNTSIIAKTESVAQITSSGRGSFNPDKFTYPINPGLNALFHWGAGVMQNYMLYRPMYLQVKLCSTCASTATGRWLIAFDYNPDLPTSSYDTFDQAVNLHSSYGDVKDHIFLNFKISELTRSKFNIRTGFTASDLMDYDLGHLIIMVETDSSFVVGDMVLSYKFMVWNSVPKPLSQSAGFEYGWPDVNITDVDAMFSSATVKNNYEPNSPVTPFEENKLKFLVDFTGIFVLALNGDGFGGSQDYSGSNYMCMNIVESAGSDTQFYFGAGNSVEQWGIYYATGIAGSYISFEFGANGTGSVEYLRYAYSAMPYTPFGIDAIPITQSRREFNPIMPTKIKPHHSYDKHDSSRCKNRIVNRNNEVKLLGEVGDVEVKVPISDEIPQLTDREQQLLHEFRNLSIQENVTHSDDEVARVTLSAGRGKQGLGNDRHKIDGNGNLYLCLVLICVINAQIFPPALFTTTTRRPTHRPPTQHPTKHPTVRPTTLTPTSPTILPTYAPTCAPILVGSYINFNCTAATSFSIFDNVNCKHALSASVTQMVHVVNSTTVVFDHDVLCGVGFIQIVLTAVVSNNVLTTGDWTIVSNGPSHGHTIRRILAFDPSNELLTAGFCGPIGTKIIFQPNTNPSRSITSGDITFSYVPKISKSSSNWIFAC